MCNVVRNVLWVLLLCSVAMAGTPETKSQPGAIRRLLADTPDSEFDSQALPKLFRVGDSRIADLARALADSDSTVSRRAELVLRYLGSPKGLDALKSRCPSPVQCKLVNDGPVPIPLMDFDYEVIQALSQSQVVSPEMAPLETYIFALALDGSGRSKGMLARWLERSKTAHSSIYLDQIFQSVQNDAPQKTFAAHRSLAEAVVANAFFLQPTDRTVAKARLIAMSSAGDKALVELHINHGVTAERWYHIVVVKRNQQWRLFSVYLQKQG